MQGILLIAILLFQAPAQRPASVISGRVAYSDGTPAAATPVTIGLLSQAPTRLGITNLNGEFRILNVAPGRYYLRLGTATDAPLFYPGVTTESAATVITVTADGNPDPINFALPQSATVRVLATSLFRRTSRCGLRISESRFPVT